MYRTSFEFKDNEIYVGDVISRVFQFLQNRRQVMYGKLLKKLKKG